MKRWSGCYSDHSASISNCRHSYCRLFAYLLELDEDQQNLVNNNNKHNNGQTATMIA